MKLWHNYIKKYLQFFAVAMLILFNSIAFSSPLTDTSLVEKRVHISFPSIIVSKDSASCMIPFSRAGNLILIKAKADSVEGNFILDTGAPHLVLNPTYFRDHPVTIINEMEQGSVTGTISAGVNKTIVDKLSFGVFTYSAIDADLVNLGHIENNKGIKILGLLGVSLFKDFEMIIDYERNTISLYKLSKKEWKTYQNELLKDTSTYNTLPFEIIENKIIVSTKMAGKKMRLVIDCGAEASILDSRLPNKILENVTISRRIMLTGSSNQKVEALYGDMKNFVIGQQNIASLPVIITNLEKTCLSYISCIDGILGFDFLSLHKIGFNFVKRKMYIWK